MTALLLRGVEPRDRVSAARVLLVTLLLALAATLGWDAAALLLHLPALSGGVLVLCGGVIVLLVGLVAAIVREPERVPTVLWPAVALAAPLGTAAIALSSHDGTVGGRLPFVFGVVYAASQFRPAFAWAVTVLSLVADTAVAFTVLPVRTAVLDLVLSATVLPAVTVVLQMTSARQEQLVRRLDALASTDPLTGLLTRRAFEAVVEAALADDPGRTGLVLVDVDDFKHVNDGYGHPAGDTVLVELADLLRACAGPEQVVARLGGDELAMMVRGPAATLAARAQDLHARTRGARLGPTPRLTVSVGYTAAQPGWDVETLYGAADRALYAAKAAGRDRAMGPTDEDTA